MIPADIIARELCSTKPNVEQRPGNYSMDLVTDFSPVVTAILNALTSAGYRIEKDDPATTVYGRLLHRHMAAARKDFDGERRKKLFDLMEDFRAEFPDECQVWEDRYDPAIRSLQEHPNAR